MVIKERDRVRREVPQYLPRSGALATERPKCIDLFSGAGGLADGFRQAGFVVLSANDQDSTAADTFRLNFPESSFFLGPIASLSGQELLQDSQLEPGELDCLIGGPPCQSFSYNNHSRTRSGETAGLFQEYIRILRVLRPKCLVMENVPGILTIDEGTVLREIYNSTSAIGYRCEARVLYAEDYGVPQRRRRAFFLATRLGDPAALFPKGECGPAPKPASSSNPLVHRWSRHADEKYQRPTSVWSAISDLPDIGNGGGADVVSHTRKPRSRYQERMRRLGCQVYNHVARPLSDLQLDRIRHVPQGGSWRDIPFDRLPAGMKRAKATDHTRRYGRLSNRDLACTILTKCDPHWGSYVHPERDRVISVREAARLQSFDDSFRFLGSRSKQFVQVGNAVPPLVARAIGNSIRDHIELAI